MKNDRRDRRRQEAEVLKQEQLKQEALIIQRELAKQKAKKEKK